MNPKDIPTQADDSKIIKIAKLVMLLTSKDVDADTKAGCIKLDIKNGLITQNEAIELLAHIQELQDFI